MLNNLLTNVSEKTRMVEIPEAALYALLGFCIVCVGIAFLVAVVWAVGKVMSSAQNKAKKESKKKAFIKTAPDMNESLAIADATKANGELSEETVAVITAAIMAYYQQNNPKCEFTVKRIKRI